MQQGPTNPSAREEAEYTFQELRAQQLRARQLFNCYLVEEEPLQEVEDDYYVAYYEENSP